MMRGLRAGASSMELVDNGVALVPCYQPAHDGKRNHGRNEQGQRQTAPEKDLAESRLHCPGYRENHDVVDNLHDRDRHRVGG